MGLIDTITGVVSQNVGIYELEIREPLEYYFHEKDLGSEETKVFEIMDYRNQEKVNEGIVWKLDNEYFLYQDSLELKSLLSGEYELKSQVSVDSEEFCLQTTIEVPFSSSGQNKLKIIPNENDQKGISNFVIETIRNKAIDLGKRPTLILSINEKLKNEKEDWISKVKETIHEEFQTELFIDFHLDTTVYLYID